MHNDMPQVAAATSPTLRRRHLLTDPRQQAHFKPSLQLLLSLHLGKMAYEVVIHVDGGCRRNGEPDAIGAAAAVFNTPWGAFNRTPGDAWMEHLPSYPTPTAERAEVTAVRLGLRQLLDRRDQWVDKPWLNVKIYSDCQFVVNCMNQWIHDWSHDEWRSYARYEVKDGDLLEEVAELDRRLHQVGYVEYIWIPREMNEEADSWANQAMDDMMEENDHDYEEDTDEEGYDYEDGIDEDGYDYDDYDDYDEHEDGYYSEDDMEEDMYDDGCNYDHDYGYDHDYEYNNDYDCGDNYECDYGDNYDYDYGDNYSDY